MAKPIKQNGGSISWPDIQEMKEQIEKSMGTTFGTTRTGTSGSAYQGIGRGYRDHEWRDLYNGHYRERDPAMSEVNYTLRKLISSLKEDNLENDARMKRIEQRLFILEDPGEEAHESLKEAYNHYKMLEALILGTDNDN